MGNHEGDLRCRFIVGLLAIAAIALSAGCGMKARSHSEEMARQGGIRLVYRVELQPADQGRLSELRVQARDVLDRRAQALIGVSEAAVRLAGTDQIVVEVPGMRDLDYADHMFSTPGKLEWYWALNVETPRTRRRYSPLSTSKALRPVVTFTDKITGKDVDLGTAEYAKMIKGWERIMGPGDLRMANVATRPGGGYIPEMVFSPGGALVMEKWSRRYTHTGENLAAVLDGVVLSIAPLKTGAIISDEAVIDGTYDPAYVKELVQLLNSGALPVKLVLVSGEKLPPR
jgi:SecD/SecF fusion protein